MSGTTILAGSEAAYRLAARQVLCILSRVENLFRPIRHGSQKGD